MNIRIFGKSRCFKTKKVQYFKVRQIKNQLIDTLKIILFGTKLRSAV